MLSGSLGFTSREAVYKNYMANQDFTTKTQTLIKETGRNKQVFTDFFRAQSFKRKAIFHLRDR